MYSNAYYLREGEYEEADYAQNLLQSINFGETKKNITDIPVDWSVFKKIFISFVYYNDRKPNNKRLFNVCYDIKEENNIYKAKALSMYRFSNKGTPLVLYNCVIIDENVLKSEDFIMFGNFTLYMHQFGGYGWSVTIDNQWYNYFPSLNSEDVLAVIGIS